ncbi:MAG: sugar ABC transporter permease [Chloroflexota bacterium]|nr:sugar ABC transporter permease [Chloroflexota bacterium]
MIGILVFSVLPILYIIFMSFTNRNIFHFNPADNFFSDAKLGKYTFVGLDNYVRTFWTVDPTTHVGSFNTDFFFVMGNTLLYTTVCVALFFVLGLALALLLNSPLIQLKSLYRTLLILPWAAPAIMTAPIWKFFFNTEFGPINQILRGIGIQDPPSWLTVPWLAWGAAVLVNLWLSYPFFMFVILGALQSVPGELYEAAQLDGAGFWTQLRQITLPLIRPALLPAVVLSSITTFQQLNTVWILTNRGGPFSSPSSPGATEFVMLYGYRQGILQNNYGLTSAFAMIVFILLFGLTIANLRATKITKGAYE